MQLRLRFSTRTLMVAVAIVAITFGAYIELKRRAGSYRLKAALHADEERAMQSLWWWNERMPHPSGDAAEKTRDRERYLKLEEYHAELKREYEFAATHPWQLVEPDPPPP